MIDLRRMCPALRVTASSTAGTPCPPGSRKTTRTKNTPSIAPTPGSSSIPHHFSRRGASASNRKCTPLRNTTATAALATPTTKAAAAICHGSLRAPRVRKTDSLFMLRTRIRGWPGVVAGPQQGRARAGRR